MFLITADNKEGEVTAESEMQNKRMSGQEVFLKTWALC